MTRTLWYVLRRHLRSNVLPVAAVAMLVALASGAVMALVAGATRTQQALPAFAASAEADGDAVVFGQVDGAVPFEADDQSALISLLRDMPLVRNALRGTVVIVEGTSATGVEQRLLGGLAIDGDRSHIFGRPIVVDGSWPQASDPHSIAVDEELAARAGLRVGGTYRVAPFTIAQFGPAGEGTDVEPAGPAVHMRVAAIYRYPIDLQPTDIDQEGIYVDGSSLEMTPAYWEAHGPDLARYGIGVSVSLAPGATPADLEAALQEVIPDRFVVEQGGALAPTADALGGIGRAIDMQAQGMLVVAAVTGITGAALLWLLLGRRRAELQAQDAVLSGLGLAARDRRMLHAGEGAALALAGASVGVVIAIATSAWMPFGVAGRAELDRGLDVDAVVLAIGWLSTVVVSSAIAWFAGSRRAAWTAPTPSRWSAAAERLGVVAAVGTRLAVHRDARGAGGPFKTAMAGVATATAVIVAVAVTAASLELVREEPVRRGAYGHAVVGNFGSRQASEEGAAVLDRNRDVVGYNGETVNFLPFGDEQVLVTAYFDGPGELQPIVTEGRLPTGDDEIALGSVAMDRLGVDVGDTVETTLTGSPIPLEVVGTALVDDVDGSVGGPGKGGVIAEPALRRLDPDGTETMGPTWYVVRFAPGVDHAAALRRLRTDFPRAVVTPRMPADLRNIERLGGLATVLAALVGVLGTGTALLALLGALRRRRTDVAVLRTLGLVRWQVGAVVSWQATLFAVFGLLVGVPAGAVVGRIVWTGVAEGVGIEPVPVVPAIAIAAVAVAAVLILNVVALAPAHRARRLRPSEVLRAE